MLVWHPLLPLPNIPPPCPTAGPPLPLQPAIALPAECSNAEGATPLHSAALGGCARCTTALLEAGADSSLPDVEGRLPADLARPGDATLRELLKPKAAAAAASAVAAAKAAAAGAGGVGAAKSAQEQFCGLSQVGVVCLLRRKHASHYMAAGGLLHRT